MVRRRRRDPLAGGMPADVAEFVPEDWPGASEYQRYAAWFEARAAWAEANLPNGLLDMPWCHIVAPDQPWSEVVL